MKLHKNELSIDTSLVYQLVLTQFPQWAHLSLERINATGTDNVIYRLGDAMGIRLPRIPSAAPNIEKEFAWLSRLRPHLSLAIPNPIAKGAPTRDYLYPWLIFEWINGETANPEKVDQQQAAESLARFTKELRNVDTQGAPVSPRSGTLKMRDTEVRAAIEQLYDLIDTSLALRIWQETLAIPDWTSPAAWIHGDLHGGNMLVSKSKIAAVIDFGMAGIGDPAVDLMVAWTLLSAQSRETFRSIVKVDDATWDRGRGWALSFGLIALPYYRTSNPALASIALRTITEIIEG